MSFWPFSGETAIHFADVVIKVGSRSTMSKRVLIITEKALYVLSHENYQCKRRIPLLDIERLCLSELNDHFFAILPVNDNDLLLASTRKTEIVTVLVDGTKKLGAELNVDFSNK